MSLEPIIMMTRLWWKPFTHTQATLCWPCNTDGQAWHARSIVVNWQQTNTSIDFFCKIQASSSGHWCPGDLPGSVVQRVFSPWVFTNTKNDVFFTVNQTCVNKGPSCYMSYVTQLKTMPRFGRSGWHCLGCKRRNHVKSAYDNNVGYLQQKGRNSENSPEKKTVQRNSKHWDHWGECSCKYPGTFSDMFLPNIQNTAKILWMVEMALASVQWPFLAEPGW